MSGRQMAGLVLVVVGIVALVWGGVFWTDTNTVIDAGPLQVQTTEREGFALPPVLGVLSLVGGLILFFVPNRRRA